MTIFKKNFLRNKKLQGIQEPREEKQQKIENKGLEVLKTSERRR